MLGFCFLLPELHPAQQGLKHAQLYALNSLIKFFQNYIQHNKDWNIGFNPDLFSCLRLPELHPAQQGLKHQSRGIIRKPEVKLPELHPAQQGLKRVSCQCDTCKQDSFQNYIQHNKDWNWNILHCKNTCRYLPELHPAQQGLKPALLTLYPALHNSSRTTSSTTRIETCSLCSIKM